ncbi:MAG: hypothetical protein LBJ14_00880 [Desulfarculales bacterium]|nr:hypothetical protein [Desulfarculales bacterium]
MHWRSNEQYSASGVGISPGNPLTSLHRAVKVMSLPLMPGRSASALVDRIREGE